MLSPFDIFDPSVALDPNAFSGAVGASRLMQAAALAGDLLWFAVLLASSIVAAQFTDDDRYVSVVVIAVALLAQPIARRLFPSLRE